MEYMVSLRTKSTFMEVLLIGEGNFICVLLTENVWYDNVNAEGQSYLILIASDIFRFFIIFVQDFGVIGY